MSKLEWIYTCCTTEVTKEISAFWKDHDIPASMLQVDTDNLQGIMIYIVSRLRNPQIITEVHFIEKFIPLGARKSVRNLYLEMIGAACSYLLEIELSSMRAQSTESTMLLKEDDIVEDCYQASTRKRQRHISGWAVKANRASMEVDDMEFGDAISWNALCFGQSVHSVSGILENRSESGYTPTGTNRSNLYHQKSFE